MASLFKKGFDWFPFDVNFFRNKKVRMVKGRYGSDGVEFLLYLFCQIHFDGYFSKIDDDFYYIAADDLGFSYEKIGQMMNFFLERSLFDNTLFKTDKVLTSRRIQMQFQDLVKSRKQVVEIDSKLWLLSEDETRGCIKLTIKRGNSKKTDVNSRKNNQNSKKNNTEYSRVKNSRVDNSIVEERSTAAADKAIHKYEQLIGLVTPTVSEGIDYFVESGMDPELIIRIIEYACEQGKRSWQYINAALVGNLKENILTLDAYNRHQAERAERNVKNNTPERKIRRSKFNNHTDTNKKDYSKIQEEILKEMLED